MTTLADQIPKNPADYSFVRSKLPVTDRAKACFVFDKRKAIALANKEGKRYCVVTFQDGTQHGIDAVTGAHVRRYPKVKGKAAQKALKRQRRELREAATP